MSTVNTRPVAIIGAGVAGAAALRLLSNAGIECQVFEKSRGWGGRMSTKRVDTDSGSFYFDHGAQYFTVRSPEFQKIIDPLVKQKIVIPFEGDWVIPGDDASLHKSKEFAKTQRYWVKGGLNGLCKHIAGKQSLLQRKVLRIHSKNDSNHDSSHELTCEDRQRNTSTHGFSALVSTVPLPQFADLMVGNSAEDNLTGWAAEQHWDPCFALMLGFKDDRLPSSLPVSAKAGFISDGQGGEHWFCNQSKRFYPDDSPLSSWVVHASAGFSSDHFSSDPAEVKTRLLESAKSLVPALQKQKGSKLDVELLHRWRYSKPKRKIDFPQADFARRKIFLAGDALSGGRVEGAYLSGLQAAKSVLDALR